MSKPLVYLYANGNFGHSRVVDIYKLRGSSLVVRSDYEGSAERPKSEERATVKDSTLEPKCRRYYSDNQMYNDGNLMN